MKTILRNLVVPDSGDGRRPAQVVIDEASITAILGPEESADADRFHDLGGALVVPGAIDGHVHFDDPGFTDREDFRTGTRAAAAGGVTMVVDMPCTSIPPVTTAANLHEKLRIVEPKAQVDFMFWGGVSANCLEDPQWPEHLADLAKAGIASVKVYFLSGMDSFRDVDADQARRIFTECRRLGLPVGIHAEDRSVVERATADIRAAGGNDPIDYAASRPAEGEVAAARTLRDLCRETGARLHIVHLASREALDIVAAARMKGLPLSAETCPHYLLFTGDDLQRLGALLKTAPVVKGPGDRAGLWQGLADGSLLFVASDHAAGVWPEEKTTGSIWTDYGGVPGVELLLPALYSEGVARGRITLERLVELTSGAPAEFFGVGDRKGRLAPGFDADVAVIDETAQWTVRAEALHNKNRYTPLEGMTLQGRVVETWVRGRRVYSRNRSTEDFSEPAGRFVRRGAR